MRQRGLFVWTVLTVLLALSVESALSALRHAQQTPGQAGTCAAYGITFDETSIETLYGSPGAVLAAPEAFRASDSAYRILSRYGSGGLGRWKRTLRRLDGLSPERRAEQAPVRFARDLMAGREAFCAAAVPHVLSYMPDGTDLRDTTIYLTALEHPYTGATHKAHIVLALSHPMYRWSERLFGQGGSTARNVLTHELVHRGYGETRALRTDPTWEAGPVQDLIEAMHEEGMTTYVASELRSVYPSPGDTVYLRLDSELWIRTLIARLNRLLARAGSMDAGRLSKKVTRFCIKQQNAYAVGAYMARTIEERLGKPALVATVAGGPASFVRAYNSVAEPGMKVAYQPPPVPEGSVYLELRKAALAGDDDVVDGLLAAVKAHTVDPTEYEVYILFRTGELLLQQGHLELAIRAFQGVIAARPELGAGHLGLGECYLASGQDDLAREALQNGLELDPRAAWAAIALRELE
jgi:hypothetical protein